MHLWILNTEAAGMCKTPVTAYQTSRRHKLEGHTHNISCFYCGCAVYMVSDNFCIFYGVNFFCLQLFHCLFLSYASVFFLSFFSTCWLRNFCFGCLRHILLAFWHCSIYRSAECRSCLPKTDTTSRRQAESRDAVTVKITDSE